MTSQAATVNHPHTARQASLTGAHAQHPITSPVGSEGARFMQHRPSQDDPNRFYAREGVDPLSQAFPGKIAVHPGMGGRPVPRAEMGAILEGLSAQPRSGRGVVYVNVPFCETHCLYCGFYKNPYRPEHSPAFVDALISELRLWHGRPAQDEGPLHAVYLGGGTPTALEPADLKRLLLALREYLPLANDCEITVEGRTSNLTPERIEAALAGGANRFSLGVQSFNTKIRQAMGRRSSREELLERISLLQSYDQAAILVDLIYGLPMQGLEEWLDDIRTAQSLNLDGADCYQLNIYKTSLLAAAIEQGRFPAGADLAGQSRLFAAGVEAMQASFYRRLSISHWGRTPRERNLYNQYVKGNADCLAFGPGAGGNLFGHFYFNQPDYAAWLAQLKAGMAAGEKPVAMLQAPKRHGRLFRAVAEDLEQGRIDVAALENAFEIKLEERLAPLLAQWERAGLVERVEKVETQEKHAGGWRLTLAGQFWQVNLAQLLIEFLNHCLQES